MSLKSVHKKLKVIRDTSGTNDKVTLLRDYLKNGLFRRVCYLAYTEILQYKVKKFPEFKTLHVGIFVERSNELIFENLKRLSEQSGATIKDKESLFVASSIDKETYEVVKLICNKDLDAGFGAILINTARPDTIKIYPYQRCRTSAHIHHILFEPEAVAQAKADGTFTNCIVANNKIKFLSRSGQVIKQLDHLKKNMLNQPPKKKYGGKQGLLVNKEVWDKVYLGELRVWEVVGKKIMSRKKGNGIITQCIRGTADPEVAKKIFFTTWDCVTSVEEFWNMYCDIAYNTRKFYAQSFVRAVGNTNFVRFIESENIKSLDEAYSFYAKMRAQGEEGAVIKNLSSIWRDDKTGSKDMIKLKHSFECDLAVTGWNYGDETGKWANGVGSVNMESSCGKLKVKMSGLTDEQRAWDWDMMEDEIVTVEAESVSKAKTDKLHSLYLPSFIEVREDKTVADSLEEIFEIEKESKKMKRRKA